LVSTLGTTNGTRALNFWKESYLIARELSTLAVRVFSTPANSVPSERAFSIRNLIQDDKRASLSDETADKLTFVHINHRVLDRIIDPAQIKAWIQMSDEELGETERHYFDSPAGAPAWFTGHGEEAERLE
jgi:hypothetical protein